MPVPEDTDHGTAGPEAVPGGAQPGGGNWAATSSLSTWISIQWKLQHVGPMSTAACFDTKRDIWSTSMALPPALPQLCVRNRNE